MLGAMRRLLAIVLIAIPVLAQAQEAKENDGAPAAAVARKSPAELRADQLDRLFARLHTARDAADAKTVEQSIWQLWMASDSATAEVLLRQATLAMGDNANDQSLKILDQLVEAEPGFAEAWNKRATLLFNLGRFDDSLADIDRVLELEPRHFGALSGRGMILMRQKKFPQALDAYKEALDMNPTMEGVKDAVKALEKFQQPI
jgi:tetratricopeptide (TPR) repeat protein